MLRLAICDDDIAFLDEFTMLLEKNFAEKNIIIHIDKFDSGYLLIENIEKSGKFYDCVFLDIEMPKVNGFVVAKRLRDLGGH